MFDRKRQKRSEVCVPHNASYPEAISLSKDDTVTLGKTDPDNPGWIWCTSPVGGEGWVPEAFLNTEGNSGVALRDYDGMELTVQIGDMVTVIESASCWSLCETPHGKRGWIPESCVTPTDIN